MNYVRTEVAGAIIPKGNTSYESYNLLTVGENPQRIMVMFVRNEAYNGSYGKDG